MNRTISPTAYESYLVSLMQRKKLTLVEALNFDFKNLNIDTSSVFEICDYLEEKLKDLDRVQYYMLIYTGQQPDLEIRRWL